MTLKKKIFGGAAILLLILLVLVLVGYIQEQRRLRSYSYPSGRSGFLNTTGFASKSGLSFGDSAYSESAPTSSPSIEIQKVDRMIIKTGTIAMVVANVRESVAAVRVLVEQKGGFVVSSNVSGAEAQVTGAMTIRLPAKLFDEAFGVFKGLAKKVTGEYVRGEDVTEEFSDTQVQLRNLEAEETQFLEILKTAKSIQETLDVTREISRVRGQIDRLKGRLQYLEKSVAMATITINLATDEGSLPVIEQNQWRPLVVAKNALRGVLGTLKALSYLVIWVIIFGAIWIPLIVMIYFGRRWWKQRKQTPFGR